MFIPVRIDDQGNVVGSYEQPDANGIAFLDRRQDRERREQLPHDAAYLFERFGRAVYKHMREHRINITFTQMLEAEEGKKVYDELRPILQALWGRHVDVVEDP